MNTTPAAERIGVAVGETDNTKPLDGNSLVRRVRAVFSRLPSVVPPVAAAAAVQLPSCSSSVRIVD